MSDEMRVPRWSFQGVVLDVIERLSVCSCSCQSRVHASCLRDASACHNDGFKRWVSMEEKAHRGPRVFRKKRVA